MNTDNTNETKSLEEKRNEALEKIESFVREFKASLEVYNSKITNLASELTDLDCLNPDFIKSLDEKNMKIINDHAYISVNSLVINQHLKYNMQHCKNFHSNYVNKMTENPYYLLAFQRDKVNYENSEESNKQDFQTIIPKPMYL